jgi:hypothetical protein
MHLWRNHVIDWYVAESAEEARLLAREHDEEMGMDESEMDHDFEQEPDDKPLTFIHDDEGETTKTCGEWAASCPKGFWGSTET